jgi:tetratricopeptide (TPR) repeat protein
MDAPKKDTTGKFDATVEQTKKMDLGGMSQPAAPGKDVEKTILLSPDQLPTKPKAPAKEAKPSAPAAATVDAGVTVQEQTKKKSKSSLSKFIIPIVVIVILVIVYFVGISMLTKKWFNEAEKARTDKKYDLAIDSYNKIIKFKSTYPKVHKGLGLAYYEKKNNEAALAELEKELKLDKNDADVNHYIGKINVNKEDLEKAVKYFLEALKLQPADKTIKVDLADVYYLMNMFDEAAVKFAEVAQADKAYPDIFLKLASCYQKKGADVEAIESLKQAVAIKPDSFSGHYWLANLYAKTTQYADSVIEYLKVNELDSAKFEADYKNELADTYYKLAITTVKKDKNSTLKNLEEAIKLNPELILQARKDKAFTGLKANKKFAALTAIR